MLSETQNTPPFSRVIHNKETAAEKRRQAETLLNEAETILENEKRLQNEKAFREKDADMKRLLDLRSELRKVDDVARLSSKLDLDQTMKLVDKREEINREIETIEGKYSIGKATEQDQITEKAKKQSSIWPTVSGIIALLVVCWGSVVYSGNWILDRYPGAAIYNAVSFQKVVFGFSVFIAEVAGAIIATAIFFPGIGKYFNPFNRDQLDFFTDFKQLTHWQRNLVSLFLFCALLLAFVLTVSGKLD